MFMSELWHESISAENGTVKIALFYEGNYELKKAVVEKKKLSNDVGI